MTQDPTGTGAGAAPGDAQSVAPQGGDEAAARIASLEAQLAEAEAEKAKLRDQALRAVAEAENTRR
ncbi:MAG: nucleotide exchange factor GrpE, partial [Alphaproteobacteria bacterium]